MVIEMKDIYEKIKKQYKSINIKLNNNEEIIIKDNNREIKAFKNGVIYFYNGKSIAHSHDENYGDVYEIIKYYLEKEPDYFINENRKDCIIKWIIILVILVIMILFYIY